MKGYNCLWIDRLIIVKMTVVFKLIQIQYNHNWFYVCVKIDKLILKFIGKSKELQLSKEMLKKDCKDGGLYTTRALQYFKAMISKIVG